MPKTRYHFDAETLSLGRIERSFKRKLWGLLVKTISSFSMAVVFLFLLYSFFDSPKEKAIMREHEEVLAQYKLLENKVEELDNILKDMESRDDNIYRVIFETEPIPRSIRRAGSGGVNQYEELKHLSNSQLVVSTSRKIDELSKAAYIQSKSFDEVEKLAKNKIEMLASIPAIIPIPLKADEKFRISSGFGYRMHPIYKTRKHHSGIDFTGAVGTPIYATGNGKIKETKFDKGYGNYIIIDHGFGYQTVYGHLSSSLVKAGHTVKRGDLIGYMGNTGRSTAPHLHYEVRKNNKAIDPINFFFNDLTPDEFENMIEIANNSGQSLD